MKASLAAALLLGGLMAPDTSIGASIKDARK